jgi:hypothetical protein
MAAAMDEMESSKPARGWRRLDAERKTQQQHRTNDRWPVFRIK